MNVRKFRPFLLVLLLALLAVTLAAAQEAPTEPGPPPPIDPGSAQPDPRWPPVTDPVTGQTFPIVCDANWCYIQIPEGMTPEEFEALYLVFGTLFPAGCWNSGGNVCIVAPNSDEADQWLRDWANWMYYQYGNNLCVLLAMECAVPGWEPWIPPVEPPDSGNNGDGNPTPTPAPTASTARPTPRPTPAPRPTPTLGWGWRPTPTPPAPSDAMCPAAEWWRNRPTLSVDSAPPFPIVVGQDPEEMGVVYTVTVTVPPVVYRRWWAEYECRPVPDEDGDGEPDREGNCTTQVDGEDWPGEWTLKACHPQVILLPDPVAGVGRLEMTLRESSRRWIREELAQKYPGARVRMPEIRLPVSGRGWLRTDNAYVYQAVVNPKPVDPGIYDVTLTFRTTGTGVTPPLVLRKRVEQKVYLLETSIVR